MTMFVICIRRSSARLLPAQYEKSQFVRIFLQTQQGNSSEIRAKITQKLQELQEFTFAMIFYESRTNLWYNMYKQSKGLAWLHQLFKRKGVRRMLDFSFSEFYAFILTLAALVLPYFRRRKNDYDNDKTTK